MSILVQNLPLGLDEPESLLAERAAKKLRVDAGAIHTLRVVRKSFDARPRHLAWLYSVVVTLSARQRDVLRRARHRDVRLYAPPARPRVQPGTAPSATPPVVVGAGPAGLFAALLLAEAGYRPLVLERGRDVDTRSRDVRDYVTGRQFRGESNFLFGEGGAGAYSDGKLYTRTHDPLGAWIVRQFVAYGADKQVAVSGRPHVGSDKLPGICRRMREHIISRGGRFRYGARVDGLTLADGKLTAVTLAGGERVAAGCVLLGIGHSARDTYEMLARSGVALSARAFQMGLRIEHPQSLIDRAQLGPHADRAELLPADYHLVARGAAGAGDVFSFCMCPGGRVLPANHEAETICTNGGSTAARDSGFASSALVMTFRPERFGGDPLEGLAMQRRIEQACFRAAGGDYTVAAQRAEDFLASRAGAGPIDSSSLTGARGVDFAALLPEALAKALHTALEMLDQRIAGFAGPDAVLLGPETRASGPVRIDRGRDSRTSVSVENLYPIGEGAGYAGGIVSAAADGLRSAEAVIARYAPVQ